MSLYRVYQHLIVLKLHSVLINKFLITAGGTFYCISFTKSMYIYITDNQTCWQKDAIERIVLILIYNETVWKEKRKKF